MRLAMIVPLLALLAALAGAPAEAAAPGQLVLRGSGNVGVDIVVHRSSSLDLQGLLPDPHADFSGIVVRNAKGAQLGLAIQVHRWATAPHAPEAVVTRTDLVLSPGTYRLELLASGPATVRLRATGDLVRTLVPRRAVRSQVTLTDLRGSGLPLVNQRYPGVRIAPTGAAVLVFFERATAHQVSVPQLCFTSPGAVSCAQGYGTTTVVTSPGSVGDGWVQSFTALYGEQGLDGTYDALVQDATVDLPAALDALLVRL